MGCAILSSGKDAVTGFIYGRLLPEVVAPGCSHKLNLDRLFREFLEEEGAPKLQAAESAEKWNPNLVKRVLDELICWEALGIPRPLELTKHGNTCITWTHPKYTEITGLRPLPDGYGAIDEWVSRQSEGDFLFVCACLLKLLGADPIFVTDTSGDGGVDLIGRIPDGPLRSMCFFVQAKTSAQRISRDTVLVEYGKFSASSRSEKFREYRRALSASDSLDGLCDCYFFVTNSEFNGPACAAARELGVLLRSKRQIAYWLANLTNRAKLESLRVSLGDSLNASLSNNLAKQLIF